MFHPSDWSAEDLAAFYAWKVEAFKASMRLFKELDLPKLMPVDHMREHIRRHVERVKAPPPSRPYARCPCHAPRFVRVQPEPEPAHGLVYLESFRRGRA